MRPALKLRLAPVRLHRSTVWAPARRTRQCAGPVNGSGVLSPTATTPAKLQACGHAEVGVCKPGTSSCEDSEWGPCVGNIDPGQRDCSSADDNDCDGSPDNTPDEACQCEVGNQRACDEHPGLDGYGRCRAGSQTCTLSEDRTTSDWSECSGSVGPLSDDTCDPGNDDNCNNEVNEGCPCVNGDTQACGHATVGICERGVSTCENSVWGPCEGNVEPEPRDCSSPLDNDCDGSDDDTKDATCQCTPGTSQACGTHPGQETAMARARQGPKAVCWPTTRLPLTGDRVRGQWAQRERTPATPTTTTTATGSRTRGARA